MTVNYGEVVEIRVLKVMVRILNIYEAVIIWALQNVQDLTSRSSYHDFNPHHQAAQ